MTLLLWIALAAVVSFVAGLIVGRLISVGKDLDDEARELDESDHEWPRHADTWRSRHRMH